MKPKGKPAAELLEVRKEALLYLEQQSEKGNINLYYGDETKRPLIIEGTVGDATLRSFMNWDEMDNAATKKLLAHWQKLGQFRKAHPAIGAGTHKMISKSPYTFSRTYKNDKVVVMCGNKKNSKIQKKKK